MQGKSALLVVSFGTAYPEVSERTIGAIEQELSAAFPQRRLYRAWTSKRILQKLKETQGISYDTLPDALERMLKHDVTDVLVQPSYLLDGVEYENTVQTIQHYKERFDHLAVGRPLLDRRSDVRELADVLEKLFADIPSSEMLAFMGHGSPHMKLPVYDLLNEMFKDDGFTHFIVGTVEHEPGFMPVLDLVQRRQPSRVLMTPLLVTAGNHVLFDMAGDHEASWKTQLENRGIKTECHLKGLGEYHEIRELYIRRAKEAERNAVRGRK